MMPFKLLLIFSFLNLAIAGRLDSLTKEELHWKSVFPNTPMPKFLHDILPKPGQSTIFISKEDLESESVNDDPPHAAYGYDNDYDYDYDVGYKGSVKESRGHDHVAGVNEAGFLDHTFALSNEGLNDPESGNKYLPWRQSNYPNVADIKENIYFFQETLLPGKKVNLPRLTRRSDMTPFLPQQIAESMPLSRGKILEILKNFSLTAESSYAHNVRLAVMHCERAEMKGEEKYCATSLESFVDLSVSMLGKNIKLQAHQLGKGLKSPLFTIGRGMRDMGDEIIVCHKMKYPYAIYLCHSIEKTTVYEVPLVSMDESKSNALAVCHKDTSAWSPHHIAFRFLKVKPGSVPICHFLDRDTVVWTLN